MALGKDATGSDVLAPVRPTLFAQARDMAVARREDASADLGSAVTLPMGWELITRGDGNVLCQLPDTAASRVRRVFGYIGAVHDEDQIFRINFSSEKLFLGGKHALSVDFHDRDQNYDIAC